jgi:hypothetical protein
MGERMKDQSEEQINRDWICERFNLKRLFSTAAYKGKPLYLSTQKKYEVLRTLLYFGISITLFLTGYFTVGSVRNLLSVVAVVGCLPASKSAVAMILYLRCKSIPKEEVVQIESFQIHGRNVQHAYDLYFTSYSKNYYIAHALISDKTIYAYTCDHDFPKEEFTKHLQGAFAADGYSASEIHVIIHPTLKMHCGVLQSFVDQSTPSDEDTREQTHRTPSLLDIIYSITL